MIEIRKLSKRFGSKTVLREINLSLATAKTHVLLGSSGCGKSTLLRILMGLVPLDAGEVLINGVSVGAGVRGPLARNVGYVIQDGGLFPHLRAEENISLGAKVSDWSSEAIHERLEVLARLAGLDRATLRRYPSELSGGQRQRVALLRALMLDPDILLLDEPLGALDPIARSGLQAELKEIFNSLNKTVLLVTHDIGEAAYFGDTITLLNDGAIEQHGSFEELARRPATAFVSEFINAQRPSPYLKAFL